MDQSQNCYSRRCLRAYFGPFGVHWYIGLHFTAAMWRNLTSKSPPKWINSIYSILTFHLMSNQVLHRLVSNLSLHLLPDALLYHIHGNSFVSKCKWYSCQFLQWYILKLVYCSNTVQENVIVLWHKGMDSIYWLNKFVAQLWEVLLKISKSDWKQIYSASTDTDKEHLFFLANKYETK